MKTVKEVSELTGISVRTLHYYDEIGLFKKAAEEANARYNEMLYYGLETEQE